MTTEKEVNDFLKRVEIKRGDVDLVLGFLCAKDIKCEEFSLSDDGLTFNEFVRWFYDDSKEEVKIDKGDYIHVEEDMDVLVLSEECDGKFVGTDGLIVHQYELTKESRFCNEAEMAKIEQRMKNNGVSFCQDSCELKVNTKFGLLEECGITSDELDELQVSCVEALDNIFASLFEGKMTKKEAMGVIDAFNTLVELGELYE